MASASGITQVLVAGGGTMGQVIAAACVRRGFTVRVFDLDPEALQKGTETRSIIGGIMRHETASIAERTQILQTLRVETDLETAAQGCDLVIECLPELLKLKREFFQNISRLLPPPAILATNSSLLVPSQMREGVTGPERFAALHFLNEAHGAEIMGHDDTSPETVQRLELFVRQLGFLAVVCRKERSGCVLNTMLSWVNFAALTLAAEGCASIEDIDRLWMMTARCPLGPFANLDLIGLDTAHDITRLQASLTGDEQMRKTAEFLKDYVKQGRLGVKTMRGFYDYPNPAYEQPGFLEPKPLPGPDPKRKAVRTSALPARCAAALVRPAEISDPHAARHFTATLDPRRDGFLHDCVVKETPILPAAAVLELWAEAACWQLPDDQPVEFEDVRFENRIRCFSDEPQRVHVLEFEGDDRSSVWELRQEFRNRAGVLIAPRRLCAVARQRKMPSMTPLPPPDVTFGATEEISLAELIPEEYGPLMQRLRALSLAGLAGRGEIAADDLGSLSPQRSPGWRHSIPVMEAALTACHLYLHHRLRDIRPVPFSMRSLWLGRRPYALESCAVTFVCRELARQHAVFDLWVHGVDRELLMSVQGYRCAMQPLVRSSDERESPHAAVVMAAR
jgi:3-hydroxyacyl-CoA dehydrogenase